jgi:hypothetical protein
LRRFSVRYGVVRRFSVRYGVVRRFSAGYCIFVSFAGSFNELGQLDRCVFVVICAKTRGVTIAFRICRHQEISVNCAEKWLKKGLSGDVVGTFLP